MPQELQITIGSKIIGDCEKKDIMSDAAFNYFVAHFVQKYLGPARAAAMSATKTLGKEDADDDDDNSAEFGPDVNEDAFMNEKKYF